MDSGIWKPSAKSCRETRGSIGNAPANSDLQQPTNGIPPLTARKAKSFRAVFVRAVTGRRTPASNISHTTGTFLHTLRTDCPYRGCRTGLLHAAAENCPPLRTFGLSRRCIHALPALRSVAAPASAASERSSTRRPEQPSEGADTSGFSSFRSIQSASSSILIGDARAAR